MKDLARLVITLTGICLVAGLLLAVVNGVTEQPIREAYAKERSEALREVLPPCDPVDTHHVFVAHTEYRALPFQLAYRNGAIVGAAFEVTSTEGYGGDIRVMVGVNTNRQVQGIKILRQKETPGLGARIEERAFRDRFAGRHVHGTRWAVTRDGGDIDAITAATISSRAVVDAVREGLEIVALYEEKILGKRPAQPGRVREKATALPSTIGRTLMKPIHMLQGGKE